MNHISTVPKVLAPAGDMERLMGAVAYGADEVYLGGQMFGMRAGPRNFTPEELKTAVDFCHQQGVRVYLTCNTVPLNREIPQLESFLYQARDAGVDALIVADMGIFQLARKLIPEMELHVSTQAGVTNYLTANTFYQMGASRVVLARELSLEEIREIRQKTPKELEIEVFVHGAMCMSFSGRCLLSQYMVGRDANRGECAQPCRWGYHLMEEKRPGEYYPVYEDSRGSYILNAKDLCMIEYIDQLAQAGVTSLKIEGRAKSAYYVSVVTNAYRNAVDAYRENPDNFVLPDWIAQEVRKVSHRAYSTGFYFGRPEQGQYYENAGYVRTCDIVAVVEGYQDGRLLCTMRNCFCEGEQIEVLPFRGAPQVLQVRDLRDGEGNPVQRACHPMMELSFPCSQAYPKGTILCQHTTETP